MLNTAYMCYFPNAMCLFSCYPTLQVPLAPHMEIILLKTKKKTGDGGGIDCFVAKVVCWAAAL